MCPFCDNPDLTQADYFESLTRQIERFGWIVQAVEAERAHARFAYTVGLTDFGTPELVVTGMRQERAHRLLNEMAAHSLGCRELRAGHRLSLDAGLELEVVELPNPDAHLFTAVGLYGPRISALQLVWADDHGRWPWERGHRGGRGGQPVLGPRATARSASP